MSQLDSELNALRIRLATLEEQKRIESEIVSAAKEFRMKVLEELAPIISNICYSCWRV